MLRTETPCQLQTPIKSIEFFLFKVKMKEIQLTQGQVALVDDEDYERVSQYKWHAALCPTYADGGQFLVVRSVRTSGSPRKIFLHRFLMDAQKGEIIDHIDGNTLNNQRKNLRFATRSANGCNNINVLHKNNTSGVRGVHWQTSVNKWQARIRVCGEGRYLGSFTDKIEAAKAYNEAAKKYHGEFATLNPIEGEE